MQSHPIVELRQYTLKPGRRGQLIDLFEREFIETQEMLGIRVFGTFRDAERPDRFVWVRGYPDMETRRQALETFYTGPVWEQHRDAANDTMLDSDDVLLLRAPGKSAEFRAGGERPGIGASAPAGLVVAAIAYLNASPGEVLATFEKRVRPSLEAVGVPVDGWFLTETAPNNFPRHPIREGENVLVWFTRYSDESDRAARYVAAADATAPLRHWLARPCELLRLKPTSRSLMR